MKYLKGTFIVIPNREYLKGKPSEMQAIYMWLVSHSNENGECFPKRKNIATEAGCNIKTVDKYIKQLEEEDFLTKTQRLKKNSKELESNLYQLLIKGGELNTLPSPKNGITPCTENGITPSPKNGITPCTENGITPSPKNGAVTITNVTQPNRTIITAKAEPKEKIIILGQLPTSRGKTYILRVMSVYCDLFRDRYGYNPTINIGHFGKTLKPILVTHTELQVSAMLITFFNWAGMTGDNAFDRNKVCSASHPFTWFFSTLNQYETYLRNIQKLDLDSESDTIEFVSNYLIKLKQK